MIEGRKWNLVPGVDLVWQQWDDESVAYDKFSGDLHLFDLLTSSLLRRLVMTQLDEKTLIADVAQTLDAEADEEFVCFIQKSLSQLSMLQLVQSSK